MHTKIIIMLLAASLAALSGYGQTEKGTTIIGVGYSPSFQAHLPVQHETTFRAGHFLKNNLLLGTEATFHRYARRDFYESKYLSVGLTGRYYFNIKSPRLKLFLLAGAGYVRNWGSYRSNENNTETAHTFSGGNLYLKVGAGASYQFSKHFSLETTLEHRLVPFAKNPYSNTSMNIGLNYHFGNKKNK